MRGEDQIGAFFNVILRIIASFFLLAIGIAQDIVAEEKSPDFMTTSATINADGVPSISKGWSSEIFRPDEQSIAEANLESLSILCTSLALHRLYKNDLNNDISSGVEVTRGEMQIRISDRFAYSLCSAAEGVLMRKDKARNGSLFEKVYVKIRVEDSSGERG